MRVTRKIAWSIVLPGCLAAVIGVVAALGCLNGFGKTMFSGIAPGGDQWMVLVAVLLGALLIGILSAGVILWILLRRVIRPVLEAERFASALASGEKPTALSVAEVPDDEMRALFVALNSLRDRQQSLAGKLKLGLTREIERRREIERYDELQLNIVSRMLPETRRSLGVIKALTLAEMIELDGGENSGHQELLRRILRKIGALSREIEQVFDLSRLDRGRWREPRESMFPTGEFVRDLVNRCKIPLSSRKVGFSMRYSSGVPEVLHADRELLFQLLNILIRSVGRATGAGGAVTFGCSVESHRVVFEIRDSRLGVCLEDLAECFNRMLADGGDSFAYVSEASISVLGLGIVRDIANRIGCKLKVDSDLDSHTVLRFYLPLGADSTANVDFRTASGHTALAAVSTEEGFPRLAGTDSKRMEVLLCDDVSDEAEVYARLLAAAGIDATVVSSLSELEKKLAAIRCDAVVLVEPVCDPDEYPARLRKIVGSRRLPIVVVASSFTEEQFRRLVDHGRVWCLNMPLNYQLLCDLLLGAAVGGDR